MGMIEFYVWGLCVLDVEWFDCMIFDFDFDEDLGFVEVKCVV